MPTIIYDLYEWDSNKDKINKLKHGIDFELASEIFNDLVLEFHSKSPIKEHRTIAIGLIEQKEIAVIYTERGKRKRIISARRARENERKRYQELCKKLKR